MDVISMQIANKILRKINRNYNGFYEVQTATAGQTVFNLSKEYGFGQHTLGVYVDGAYAYETDSYVEVDNKTVRFNAPMDGGELLLFRTEVAGTVSYPILNPAYDDTEVRNLIKGNSDNITTLDGKLTDTKNRVTTAEGKIDNIIAVLDADNDGAIVDALADLKTQWESADGDIKTLINDKVDSTTFTTLSDEVVAARGTYASLTLKLQAIVDSIKDYDDTTIKQDISDIKQDIIDLETAVGNITTISDNLTKLTDRVTALEGKTTATLKDTVTGWDYSLAVTNGVLVANLIKVFTSIDIARDGGGTELFIGDVTTVTATPKYQDGTTANAVVTFSVDNSAIATVDGVTGQVTGLTTGDAVITATGVEGEITKTASLTLSVKVDEVAKVQTAQNNLTLGDISAVTTNLTLPTSQDECTVTWVSDKPLYITDAGVVQRPAYLEGNQVVKLTATISYGTASGVVEFNVTVVALDQTDAEKLSVSATNFDTTMGAIDLANIISDFTLPVAQNYANVAWSVDANSYLAISGGQVTVTSRPTSVEGNQTLTLTATLSVNAESVTKTYSATVIALAQTDQEKLDAAAANLSLGDTTAVTSDITLPTEQDGVTITQWVSSDSTIVEVTGTTAIVHRPALGSGDAMATLTATLEVNGLSTTVDFVINVLALTA